MVAALTVTVWPEASIWPAEPFAPDPTPQPSAWADVLQWVRYTVRPPQGRAIVFARAHLSYDLTRLDPSGVKIQGDRIALQLPPLQCQVELLPAETEVVSSNLDSAQTAGLLERARGAFEKEVLADPAMRARAERGAQGALQVLLSRLGFREVQLNAS